MPLPEDVSDAAAGENLQAASAHPHPEGEFWGRGGGQIRGHQWCCLICIAPKPQTTRAALPRQQMAASWKSAGLKLLLGSFHAPLPCNFEGQRRHFNARAAPTTSAEYMKHRLAYHYYYYFCVCHAANSRDGRKYSSKRSQFSPNIVLYVYVIHIQETFFFYKWEGRRANTAGLYI